MLILVYVRSRITPEVFDSKALILLETPQYTIDLKTDNTFDLVTTQARLDAFSEYYGYNISVTDNSTSPLNFNPSACTKESSWVLPKVASSIIAIVAPTSNPVM